MTVLVATDSFKDALPALEVCRAIERGIRLAVPAAAVRLFPLADGGEGTAGVLTYHSGGQTIRLSVQDPLFRPVTAQYGLSGDGQTAFMEMAQASGLQRLQAGERNPLKTSTYGTGEMILDAIRRGARRILLGIGGSATNDGGMGMAAALGYRFLDQQGRELRPIGENLSQLDRIDDRSLLFDAGTIQVEVLCDVDNPLFGEKGAARIYAPQKGAGPEDVDRLDAGLKHFAGILTRHCHCDFSVTPGAGAAGGLGAGAMAFLGAILKPGIETVMRYTHFARELDAIDLIITGEGRIDAQTLHGKLIQGVCRIAREKQVPVIALCGALSVSPAQLAAIGLQAAFSISRRPQSLEEALAATGEGLENLAFNVVRLLNLGAH